MKNIKIWLQYVGIVLSIQQILINCMDATIDSINAKTVSSIAYEFPSTPPPRVAMRLDKQGNPVERGRIHQLLKTDYSLEEFNDILQCPSHQPDLTTTGSFELL
jgi:hypothetical protein